MSERDAVTETAAVASIPPPDRGAGRSTTALYLDDLHLPIRDQPLVRLAEALP